MGQCTFVAKGYVVDQDDLEIYNNYNCVKPEGHSGRHSFYKNPSKFHKTKRGAIAERKRIIEARNIVLASNKVLKKIESKGNKKIQKTGFSVPSIR